MFPVELNVPASIVKARHEYFEEFPEMRLPFTTQISYWANRLLMTEQNSVAPPSFTLNFLGIEDKELNKALISPEYAGHVVDEAADVAVVSFIAPAFWSSEVWKAEGDAVIKFVQSALELSGLTPTGYACAVDGVIKGKNSHNYLPVAFTSSGVKSLSTPLYRYTASHLKDVRKSSFDNRMPADANIVYKHRHNGAVEKVGGDKRYDHLLVVAKKIDAYREKIGASPIY